MKRTKPEFLLCKRSWKDEKDVEVVDSFTRSKNAEKAAEELFNPDENSGFDFFVMPKKLFEQKYFKISNN